jgi:hypothetical protein
VSSFQYALSAFLVVTGLSASMMTTPSLTKVSASTEIQSQSDDSRSSHSIAIFVSATDGDDHWTGRFPSPSHDRTDGPLATLDHAREVVQSIDKTAVDRVTVFFRGGTYYPFFPLDDYWMPFGSPLLVSSPSIRTKLDESFPLSMHRRLRRRS